MTGQLFIENENIGQVDFKIIDESMGVIAGKLIPNENYKKYQPTIQAHFERNGISNIHDFKYKIKFNNCEIVADGGIGVSDSKQYNGIYVESGGVDQTIIEKLKLNS